MCIHGLVVLTWSFIRLERLDHLAKKFRHKCDIHEEWSYGKEDMLQAQDFKKCRLNELKVCVFVRLRIDEVYLMSHIFSD